MTRKIIILGIDGLEYTLVEEWNLKYLKQKAYTKTDLSDFGVVITPLIWAAMLTGKKIDEIEKIFLKRARFFSENPRSVKAKTEQYLFAKIASKVLPEKVKRWIIKNILPDVFEKTKDILRAKNYTTIFDFFDKTWTNGLPAYGRNVVTTKSKKLHKLATEGNPKPLYKYSLEMYKKEKRMLLDALKKDYQLIFWYTPFLDKIEHFYINKKSKLLNIYIDLNKLVRKIYEIISSNDILYIVSDHGMVPVERSVSGSFGEHSDYGFFSSNTGELIKKPQDLFDLVVSKKANHR